MPFDPESPQSMERLVKCVEYARTKMKPMVDNRKLILDELAGPMHTTKNVARNKRMPINSYDEMFGTLTRTLVDQNPTCRVVNLKQQRTAAMIREELQRRIVETNLYLTLQDCVQDALIRIGVVKVGIASTDKVEIEGYWHDVGKPYADFVGLDSFVIDLRGDREDEIDFVGNSYSRRLDYLRDNPNYNQDVVEKLGSNKTTAREGKRNYSETLYDWVDLLDVYLPQSQLIVTISDEAQAVPEPLRIVPYNGPEGGPYLYLRFSRLLGSIIPTGPAPQLFDLHDFNNRAYRRVFRQADRQAEYWTYTGDAEADAEAHKAAYDGQFIRVDNPQGVTRNVKGGVSPHTLGTARHGRDLFNERAGNLRAQSGTGISAGTLGQEQQLAQGVGRMIGHMRNEVHAFTAKILENWAQYIWNDPLTQAPQSRMVGGRRVEALWTPEEREGDVLQFEFDIVPGSLTSRSNEEQAASLLASTRAIMETMQFPATKPVVFDHAYFAETLGEYLNQPELGKLVSFAPDAESVYPGTKAAVNKPPTARPVLAGGDNSDAEVERLMQADVQTADTA